ncbi:MAG TPA: hypothetical protein VF338_04500 [Leptolinea sp.]
MSALISKIQKAYPFFIIAAILILLGLSAYSSFHAYKVTSDSASGIAETDMVTAWDKRLRKVRLLLPDQGIVGYLADWDIPGYNYGSSDQEVEFLLAQYTVAPVVLERGTKHKLVLGNFSDNGDPQKIPNIEAQFGIHLVQTYSNEIFLFEVNEK